ERKAISCCRPRERTDSKPAMFTHAMSSTVSTAPKSTRTRVWEPPVKAEHTIPQSAVNAQAIIGTAGKISVAEGQWLPDLSIAEEKLKRCRHDANDRE